MHISDVYSIYYLYPGLVILFSFIYLKEKVGWFDYVCLVSCFIGAILIVKPHFIFGDKHYHNNSNSLFFLIVFCGALLKAIEDVIVRDVGKEVHFLMFPFSYAFLGILLFPIPMAITDKVYPNFSLSEVIVLFLIGFCTFSYQMFMALGFQNENAGRVSLVNYVQVGLMYLSDLFLFGKGFNYLDLTGTMLIFVFNIINGIIKATKRMKQLKELKAKNSKNNNNIII